MSELGRVTCSSLRVGVSGVGRNEAFIVTLPLEFCPVKYTTSNESARQPSTPRPDIRGKELILNGAYHLLSMSAIGLVA